MNALKAFLLKEKNGFSHIEEAKLVLTCTMQFHRQKKCLFSQQRIV